MSTHHCPMCEQADIALSSPCLLHGSWYGFVHTLNTPKILFSWQRKGSYQNVLQRHHLSIFRNAAFACCFPNLPLSLRTVSSAEISMTYTSFPYVGEKNIWRKTENNFTARMCREIWTRHLEHMETWGQLEQLFTHEWDETIYATRKFLLQQHFLLILVILGKNWNKKILCDLAGTVFSWEIKFSENLITERELWWDCLTGSVWRSWLALAKLHTRKKAS